MKKLIGLVAVLGVALCAGNAVAAGKKDQAETHYDQGKAYYRAGAFDLAIQEFLEGYKLDPRAGVLFNIARGYEELKNRDKAIEFYKKYIDQGAQATAATEARARLVVLERQAKEEAEKQKAVTTPPPPAPVTTTAPPPPPPAPTTTTTMPPPAETKAPAPATPSDSTVAAVTVPTNADASVTATAPASSGGGGSGMKTAGLVVGGAGVALVGVGGFFAFRASSLKSEALKETKYDPGKDSQYHTAGTIAVATFIGGALAIAGGAALYVLGSNKESGAAGGATPTVTAHLSPVVGPDGGGVLFTGRF